jgi:hypothetical protein
MVQDISNALSSVERMDEPFDTRGQELEYYLIEVAEYLGMAGNLTEKKADMEFLLGIVGSYLIAKEEGKIEEDTKTPSQIFDERLFPVLDEQSEIVVEEITDEEEGTE